MVQTMVMMYSQIMVGRHNVHGDGDENSLLDACRVSGQTLHTVKLFVVTVYLNNHNPSPLCPLTYCA